MCGLPRHIYVYVKKPVPVSARIANKIPVSILKGYEEDWLLQQIKSAMAASGELRDRLCCSKLSSWVFGFFSACS